MNLFDIFCSKENEKRKNMHRMRIKQEKGLLFGQTFLVNGDIYAIIRSENALLVSLSAYRLCRGNAGDGSRKRCASRC